MTKHFFILAFTLAVVGCDSGSKPKPSGNVAVPPTHEPDPNHEFDSGEASKKIDLSGIWGVSLFERRCHLFYTFKTEDEVQGQYTSELYCSGRNDEEILLERHEGNYQLELSEFTSHIAFEQTTSSCGRVSRPAQNEFPIKQDRTQLNLNNAIYDSISPSQISAQLDSLTIHLGCFQSGDIQNFVPRGASR